VLGGEELIDEAELSICLDGERLHEPT
jgi:hypothetical protein